MIIYPSGEPIKLFRAGGDFSFLASSWKVILPIAMIVVYVAFRAQRWPRWGVNCVLAYIAINFLTPLNPFNQPAPPEAVSLATARYALAQDQSLESTDYGAYVMSQIAFTEGRKSEAKRLADSITSDDRLESPFEAPWRLQYLRQEPVSRSTVCWLSGCASTQMAEISNLALRVSLGIMSASIIFLTIALNKINRRSRMIEKLAATRRRHMTQLLQSVS